MTHLELKPEIERFRKFPAYTRFQGENPEGDANKLKVSEIFLSLQGEGPRTGRPSIFLRTSGCTLTCSFCDTLDVWTKGEHFSVNELVYFLCVNGPFFSNLRKADLVLTGGSPLLQGSGLTLILRYIRQRMGFLPFTSIETEGVISPSKFPELNSWTNQYMVSPKLESSSMALPRRRHMGVLNEHALDDRSFFKFPVADMVDFTEARNLLDLISGVPRERVGFMPVASSREQLNEKWAQQTLPNLCMDYGYTYYTRLHIQLWDKTTGV